MTPRHWGVRYFYIPSGRWYPKRNRIDLARAVDEFIKLAQNPNIAAVRLYEPGADGEDYLWEDQRRDPIAQAALRTISVKYVESVVREHFDLKRSEILGPIRAAKVARVRQIAMALAREYSGASLPAIARYFQRHHTTVMHAINVMPRNESHPQAADVVQEIREHLEKQRGGVRP